MWHGAEKVGGAGEEEALATSQTERGCPAAVPLGPLASKLVPPSRQLHQYKRPLGGWAAATAADNSSRSGYNTGSLGIRVGPSPLTTLAGIFNCRLRRQRQLGMNMVST